MYQFYVLEPEDGLMFGRKWTNAEVIDPVNYGEAERCPVCGGFVSLKRWLPPYRIKLSTAKQDKWGDFVWGAGFTLLISKRFKEIYEKEGLTGIDDISPPVEIVRIGILKPGIFPSPSPDYHHIHIPWGGANQDDAASNVIYRLPKEVKCNYCRTGVSKRFQDRIIIEQGSWNGSDIFQLRGGPGRFLVSQKFRQVVEENDIKNCWLIPNEKYGYDATKPGTLFIKE